MVNDQNETSTRKEVEPKPNEIRNTGSSTTTPLILVDDNPNFKRYRLVMKKRHQVNIEYTGSDRIQSFKQEDRGFLDMKNVEEYIKKEYPDDHFDPRSTLMSRQNRKIQVVREGKETELNVYHRN
jgi:hypothetical protein